MAVITGTPDNDFLTGSLDHEGDSISGLGGNDRIDAGRRTKPNTGTDFVDGGAGIDTLLFRSNGLGGNISLNVSGSSVFVRSSDNTFFVDAVDMERVEFFGGLGDDTVSTGSMARELDAGGGIDTWTADYSAFSSNMVYTVASGIGETLPGVLSIENFDRINLTTGSGNDRVSTRGFGDHIITGAGNDKIDAGWRIFGETDHVDAGLGNDTLVVFTRSETQGVLLGTGGSGHAFVRSVSEKYHVDAGGVESIEFTGGHGNDTVNTGTLDRVKVAGNEGIDHWLADLGSLTTDVNVRLPFGQFAGGRFDFSGIDRLTLTTGSGDDTITTGNQADEIRSGAGDDVVNLGSRQFGDPADFADGGAGFDKLVVDTRHETTAVLLASSGPGAFSFFLRSDSNNFHFDAHQFEFVDFHGGDGNDIVNLGVLGGKVHGSRGIDHLIIDRSAATSRISFEIDEEFATHNLPGMGSVLGFDRITLLTGSGNDSIKTDDHGDDIRTGDGNDTIDAGSRSTTAPTGTDFVDGGAGTDTLIVDATFEGAPVQVFFTGSGFDVRSNSNRFFVDADNMEKLNFEGTNHAAGDRVFGGNLGDTLDGADGKDTLTGGGGRDTLRGGVGLDIFDFNASSESTRLAPDVVLDFGSGFDTFDLRDMEVAFRFIGSQGFHDVAGELRSVAGRIEGDVNGDGIADFRVILDNGVTAVRGDLLL